MRNEELLFKNKLQVISLLQSFDFEKEQINEVSDATD